MAEVLEIFKILVKFLELYFWEIWVLILIVNALKYNQTQTIRNGR